MARLQGQIGLDAIVDSPDLSTLGRSPPLHLLEPVVKTLDIHLELLCDRQERDHPIVRHDVKVSRALSVSIDKAAILPNVCVHCQLVFLDRR